VKFTQNVEYWAMLFSNYLYCTFHFKSNIKVPGSTIRLTTRKILSNRM